MFCSPHRSRLPDFEQMELQMKRLLASLAVVAAFAGPAFAEPGKVVLTVTDIAEHKGSLMVAVYADEAGYNSDKSVVAIMVPVTGATASHTFENVAPGKYGIKLFHDVNGNGKMDTNPFGAPIEPYAFSNNAKGQFGPAKWADAVVEIGADGGAHSIKLQ
jgi:uncharacterized protein (DUF2141 family)